MNIASLLVFNIDRYLQSGRRIGPVEIDVVYDAAERHNADLVARMLRSWPARVRVSEIAPASSVPAILKEKRTIAWLTADPDMARSIVEGEAASRVIFPIIPSPSSEEFALLEEFAGHDNESGGLSAEFLGSISKSDPEKPGFYASFFLRTLSAANCYASYPSFISPMLKAYTAQGRVKVLDIGCGPISRLRWGALAGELEIVGVDPLNDLYTASFARHGFDVLPEIRPSRTIACGAENIDLGGETFPLVYSWNALDHAADPRKCIMTVAQALNSSGFAVLSVNTREGARAQYTGMHQNDIYYEDGDLHCQPRGGLPKSLLSGSGLAIEKVMWATDESLCLILKRA